MTFDKALRLHGISVKEEIAYACRMLESQGFEYGKDFITASAIDAAGAAILELEEAADPTLKADKERTH